jgi:hypothetical protein
MIAPRYDLVGNRALWLVESVSERLDADDNAVFDPNALHQLVRAKVVRPKLDLNVRANPPYPTIAIDGSRPAPVRRCAVHLRRSTAECSDLSAAGSPVYHPAAASHGGAMEAAQRRRHTTRSDRIEVMWPVPASAATSDTIIGSAGHRAY